MENFDRENIDELLEIRQIRQYFPHQKFALYDSFNVYFLPPPDRYIKRLIIHVCSIAKGTAVCFY